MANVTTGKNMLSIQGLRYTCFGGDFPQNLYKILVYHAYVATKIILLSYFSTSQQLCHYVALFTHCSVDC